MAENQLIVAVEGTGAMGPYWSTILSDYLEKIIRSFSATDVAGQKLSTSSTEFLLITFNCHGPYSACLVQRSGWTRDADAFLQWLSAIPFNGGGFNDAAIAEGLAEALMVFLSLPSGGQVNQTPNRQKHCILIAASNPYPLPTLVYCPQLQSTEQGDNIDAQAKSCLSDAETVAKAFPRTSVSLSVICPRRLPKLKQIYNAGKHDARAEDPHIDKGKNPYFLVLISEKFMEACSALNRPEIQDFPSNQSSVKADVSSVTSATVPLPANGSLTKQPPVSVGSIPAATVKVEPGTATSTRTGPTSPHIPSLPCPGLQAVPVLQTSSPLQDTKPNAAANVNILNNLSQARQVMSSAALSGGSSIGLPAMNQTPVSMHVSSMVQPVQSISQGNSCGQMVQSSLGMNQNMVSNLGLSGISSSCSMIIATSGMTQQIQSAMQSLGAGNNLATMPLSQQHPGSSQSAQPKYVKIWEGKLFFQHQGQPVFITRLEAYSSYSSPETLAANWPPNLQLGRLISQDHMNNQRYAGKTVCLAFRTLDQHGYLGIMHRKKLCGVIQLPSQTLLISVSDKASRLIGMLFPGDMVVLKPKVPSQQQQMQQQPQPMQTQQIQPLQHQQQLPQTQQLSPLQRQQLPQFQQAQQQQISELQQQLSQQQQQLQQLQQQLPQMQQQQLPHQQQLQQLQQQQQMVGTGMGQAYVGSPVQSFTSQGQVSSQLKPNIPGGGYE